MENTTNQQDEKGHNANIVLAVSNPDLIFIKNFCEQEFDRIGKSIHEKPYLAGQQKAYAKVLNQIEIRIACASGAVDKTVSDGVNGGHQRDLDIYQNLIEP